jgi:hypothetical protein
MAMSKCTQRVGRVLFYFDKTTAGYACLEMITIPYISTNRHFFPAIS